MKGLFSEILGIRLNSCLRRVKPFRVRTNAVEIAPNRINEHGECSLPQDTASLSQGQDALNPPIPFYTCGPEAAFSPLNREANHALGVVVRRRDPGFPQEYPQRIHFSLKTLCERAGSAFALMVKRDKTQQPGVEQIPLPRFDNRKLPHGWRRGSHPTQTQQFFLRPYAATCNLSIFMVGHPFGSPNQVRQAGLPLPRPLPIGKRSQGQVV